MCAKLSAPAFFLIFAMICFSRAVGDQDEDRFIKSITHYQNALGHHRQGNRLSAIHDYESAISLRFEFPEAHQNLALLIDPPSEVEGGKNAHIDIALEVTMFHHHQSLRFAPNEGFQAGALSNIAHLRMRQLGLEIGRGTLSILTEDDHDVVEIIQLLRQAITFVPEWPNALITLGQIYSDMGRYAEANSCFLDVLQHHPRHSVALLNVGNDYFRKGDHLSATYYYEQAVSNISLDDKMNLLSALNNLGQAYRERGMSQKAITTFQKAFAIFDSPITISSDNKSILSDHGGYMPRTVSNLYAAQGMACYWRDLEILEYYQEQRILAETLHDERNGAHFIDLIDPYTFSLARFASAESDKYVCMASCRTDLRFNLRTKIYKSTVEGGGTQSVVDKISTSRRHLKIAYLSYDWRNHPMGRLTRRLVTSHNESRFIQHSISYGPDDKSDIRRFVQNKSQHFLDLFGTKSDAEAVSRVRLFNLDILVDITTHTYNGRINIASSKPAAVVINYLGFPGTSGCSSFDYVMVDPFVAPPETAAALFTERIIYLPHSYQSNFMPIEVWTDKIEIEKSLPILSRYVRSSVSLCSFNANKKYEPVAFAAWMQIMQRFPHAKLFLLDTDVDSKANILTQAMWHGVSTSRIYFLSQKPWKEHLRRLVDCDLVLDTFVYGAHTTTTDMLWMSVPVLSMESWGSGRMPSRVATSITRSLQQDVPLCGGPGSHRSVDATKLNNQGRGAYLDNVIVYSAKQFEDTAVRLARNTAVLHNLRIHIRELGSRGTTFNYTLMQKSVERAYQSVWEMASQNRRRFDIVILSSPADIEIHTFHQCSLLSPTAPCIAHGRSRNQIVPMCEELFTAKHFEDSLNDLATLQLLQKNFVPCHNSGLYALEKTQNYLWRDRESVERLFYAFSPILFAEVAGIDQLTVALENVLLPKEGEIGVTNDIRHFVTDILSRLAPEYDKQPLALSLHPAILEVTTSRSPCESPPSHTFKSSRVVAANILSKHAEILGSFNPNEQRFKESVLLWISALLLDYNHNRLVDIGVILQNANRFVINNAGAELLGIGLMRRHMESFHHISYESNRHDIANHNASQCVDLPDRMVIAFFCHEYGNQYWPKWGKSSLLRGGLGGSEEAVVFLSESLAARGFNVEIYADPQDEDRGCFTHGIQGGSITWLSHKEFNVSREIDVFVAWRYSASLHLGMRARKRFLWLHDIIHLSVFPPVQWQQVDVVFVQSAFHKTALLPSSVVKALSEENFNAEYLSRKISILENGVAESFHRNGTNDPTLFVYGSAPDR